MKAPVDALLVQEGELTQEKLRERDSWEIRDSTPLGILADSARRLNGLPALFVGVRCPTEITLERRRDTWGEVISTDSPVVEEVQRWQREVHTSGIYDLEVDTSLLRPVECAEVIRGRLRDGPAPSALQRFAATSTKQY